MKRRQLLVGIGALAGTGGLTLSTGAFTSVSADRTVTVDVADDDSAMLRLEPITDPGIGGEPTGRSGTFGSQVWFSLPGKGNGENQSAEGVGVDSTYGFEELLRIENRGTQSVTVYSTYDGNALADLALVRDGALLRDDPPTIAVGEHLDVGLYLDTHGSSIGEYDETLTIVADQP